MKKMFIFALATVLFLPLTLAAWSYEETKTFVLKVGDPYMTVNGTRYEIDPGRGTKPVIDKGRTLVPIRTIIENMNGTVDWNADYQQVTVSVYKKTVILTVGSNIAFIKDDVEFTEMTKTFDTNPKIVNGRTMVPVRFVTEALGAKVAWDGKKQTVTITYKIIVPGAPESHKNPWRTTHGSTGRDNVNTCVKCHTENNKYPDTGDKIANFARVTSYCYNCHLKRPHNDIWVAEHPDAARKKGLLNCFTCHDKDQPGPNVTGTYCNTCHWFAS